VSGNRTRNVARALRTPELPGQPDARDIGQHPVQEDQVRHCPPDDRLRGRGIGGGLHRIAGVPQIDAQQFLDGRFVFNDQNRGGHGNAWLRRFAQIGP